jgi:protein-disulfide isomerase
VSTRKGQKQANRLVREQLAAERRRTRTIWISVIAALVLVVAGIIGWGILRSQSPDEFVAPPGVTDDGGNQAGIVAAGNGPDTVEVYLDFLCPACRQFETVATPTLNQLAADGKIRLVWHTLGFLDSRSSPAGYSTRAANASACAADAGKLKAYGEALFANQPAEGGPGLSDDQLIDLGGPVGLNAPSFAQCVRDMKYRDWVSNVNDKAAQRGVFQTPTVYVNGQVLPQPTPENITAAVG